MMQVQNKDTLAIGICVSWICGDRYGPCAVVMVDNSFQAWNIEAVRFLDWRE